MFILCSCALKGSGSTAETGSSGDSDKTEAVENEFPVDPDKIIVGTSGKEKEVLPDDKAYDEIISRIKDRVRKSGSFDDLLSIDHDPDSGKHLSFDLRQSETFVEFVYDKCISQTLQESQPGGSSAAEKIDVCRIFFPLTREYHFSFFIGKDPDYANSAIMGDLVDNTSLVSYVEQMFN